MSTKTTEHFHDGEHYETTERTRSDGFRTIVESKVTDTPLGRLGSNIVRETEIDKLGNSTTKTRR